MKRPLTRKLIVKERLEKDLNPCRIIDALSAKGIHISRMTLWRDAQEVKSCSTDELIWKHEMGDIERRKSLLARQRMAVQAKNSIGIVEQSSGPDKPREKKRPASGPFKYQVMRGKELEDFFKDTEEDRYRSPLDI
jgi:hypothetical protein